ncbi:hypothetical protein JCM6882_008367 [Rhodosporidiobolus microsporus]
MLLRRCSHTLSKRRLHPEVSAALAQLPAFLVPSFAAVVEVEGGQTNGTTEGVESGARGRSARSSRLSSPISSWQLSSSSFRPPSLAIYSRSIATSARALAEDAGEGAAAAKEKEREAGGGGGGATEAESKVEGEAQEAKKTKKRPPRPRPPPNSASPASPSPSSSSSRRPLPSDALPSTFSEKALALEAIKKQLFALPAQVSLPTLLHFRQLLKREGYFASPKAIKILATRLLSNFYDGAALRLINEAVGYIRDQQKRRTYVGKKIVKQDVPTMYESPLRHVLRRPVHRIDWSWIVDMTNSALHRNAVTPFILSVRMRALYEVKRYKDVEATFQLFAEHGFDPTGADYDEAILSRLLSMELKAAQELLAVKGEKGFPTTVRTCLALLEGMEPYGGNSVMEQKMLSEADEAMLQQRQASRQDVRVLNRILSVRAAREELRDALDVLNYFDFSRFPPDLVSNIRQLVMPRPSPSSSASSSIIPPSTSSASDAAPPQPSISPSVFWRPQPDLSTVVTLAGLSLRQQRADLALSVLLTAYNLSLGFNAHVALSIVRTLLSLHEIDAAEDFVYALADGEATFAGLRYPALRPTSFLYEELFGGILRYRGLGGLVDSLDTLREERNVSVRVTEGITAALVKHLSLEAEKPASVSTDLLVKVQQLTTGKVRPTAAHLSTLLRAAWQTERTTTRRGRALPVEEEFPIPDETSLPPPEKRSHLSSSPPEPRPSPTFYLPPESELLAPRPGSERSPSSLTRVRDSLADRSVAPTRESTRHLLRNDHLLRFIPAKWAYLQSQVLDYGVRPTVHHLTSLMRAYLLLGDAKGAQSALTYAFDELHLPPHVALYSTLIAGLSRLGDHAGALSTYRDLLARGIEPDRTLFAALAMACARRRDLAGVERVLDEVRKVARQRDPPHPQLVALAQAQGQALRARSGGVPATMLAAYDPLLDPVFVTILYRTLVSLDRLGEAQERVRESLEKGLVPDAVLLMALRRSEHWLRRKRNNATGRTPSPGTPSSLSPPSSSSAAAPATPSSPTRPALTTEIGLGSAKVGTSGARLSLAEMDALLALVESNISRVQKSTRRARHEMSWASLKRLQAYWAQVEREEKEAPWRRGEEWAEEEAREGLKELEEQLRNIEEESQSYSISS